MHTVESEWTPRPPIVFGVTCVEQTIDNESLKEFATLTRKTSMILARTAVAARRLNLDNKEEGESDAA